MSESAAELVRRIYGYNWASTGSRQEGIAQARELLAPEFELRLDPAEFGDRTLKDRFSMEAFVQSIEEDFRELRHRADRFEPADSGEDGERVLVLGEAVGRGRLSGFPFRTPFGHLWTVKDGRAVHVETYLDHELALAAADLVEGGSELSDSPPA